MGIKTIDWANNSIKLIDQTLLPGQFKYIYIDDLNGIWNAIKEMKVRGAPALAAAAALGVYVGCKDSRARSFSEFSGEVNRIIAFIGLSRPTARNLFWGLERMRRVVTNSYGLKLAEIKNALLNEARAIINEDRKACRSIGNHGAKLFKNGDSVLTICNTGILATVDYGTALGVIYSAVNSGKKIKVYACETRPMFQGARLTSWELKRHKIDVTLVCDSMAAALMKQGKIDKVIAGADRIAANGDTANKIGTYSLAVLSRYHNIPFYIAAPESTIDKTLRSGKHIVIEERNPKELTDMFFKKPIAPKGVKVYNPAFDITDNKLISAIITDKGTVFPPFKNKLVRL